MLCRHVLPAKSVRPLVDAKEKGLNKIQLKKRILLQLLYPAKKLP